MEVVPESYSKKNQIPWAAEEFLESVKLGEVSKLENMIEIYGKEILKSVTPMKDNALHLSAENGSLEGTKVLVEKHDFNHHNINNSSQKNALKLAQDHENFHLDPATGIRETVPHTQSKCSCEKCQNGKQCKIM